MGAGVRVVWCRCECSEDEEGDDERRGVRSLARLGERRGLLGTMARFLEMVEGGVLGVGGR